MKHSKNFWLHCSKKDYIENSNFAAEILTGQQAISFPLFFCSF